MQLSPITVSENWKDIIAEHKLNKQSISGQPDTEWADDDIVTKHEMRDVCNIGTQQSPIDIVSNDTELLQTAALRFVSYDKESVAYWENFAYSSTFFLLAFE